MLCGNAQQAQQVGHDIGAHGKVGSSFLTCDGSKLVRNGQPATGVVVVFFFFLSYRGLAEEVETGMLGIEMGQRRLGDELVSRYEWDLMAARNVWAFG